MYSAVYVPTSYQGCARSGDCATGTRGKRFGPVARPPVSLSAIEMAAFGNDISLDDEKKVAVMTERRLKSGNISDTYNASYREKFFVSQAEVEKLLRSSGSQRRARSTVRQLRQREAPVADTGDDDDAEDWIHKK